MCKPCSSFCKCMGFWVFAIGGWLCPVICIVGLGVGCTAAATYAENRRAYDLYTNTTCSLLKYSFHSRICEICDDESCTTYECFDEQFLVEYSISNGTVLISSFSSNGNRFQHDQVTVNIVRFVFTKSRIDFSLRLALTTRASIKAKISMSLLGSDPSGNQS